MDNDALEKIQQRQLEIVRDTDTGQTKIVFRKALIKGKVKRDDVMDALMVAARMQAEKYIEKLSRGAPLEPAEVRALKELSEMLKLDTRVESETNVTHNTVNIQSPASIDIVKASIYEAIAAKNASNTAPVDVIIEQNPLEENKPKEKTNS